MVTRGHPLLRVAADSTLALYLTVSTNALIELLPDTSADEAVQTYRG